MRFAKQWKNCSEIHLKKNCSISSDLIEWKHLLWLKFVVRGCHWLLSQAAGCEVVVVVQSITSSLKHDLDVAYNFVTQRSTDWSLDQYVSEILLLLWVFGQPFSFSKFPNYTGLFPILWWQQAASIKKYPRQTCHSLIAGHHGFSQNEWEMMVNLALQIAIDRLKLTQCLGCRLSVLKLNLCQLFKKNLCCCVVTPIRLVKCFFVSCATKIALQQ